jgi:hypothetical protein
MTPTPHPMWARALIEAGKTAVFLASFFALGTFIYGVVHFQLGALIVLAMLLAIGIAILIGYINDWREWRHR